MINIVFKILNKYSNSLNLVIECDGHDFHQKTKEQVEYDNQRQRDLQNEGIEIIRFSGSEIWKDVRKCVNEIQDIILSKCKYIQEEK